MKRKREAAGLLAVVPECCPEAVQLWGNGNTKRGKSDLTEKARKHLSAMGWKFWYARVKGNRTELRYESPTGKIYYSLRTACKGCIESQGLGGVVSESVGSNSMEYSSNNITSQSTPRKGAQKRKISETLNVDDKSPKRRRGKVLADLRKLRDHKKASSQRATRALRSSTRAKKIVNQGSPCIRSPRNVLSWLIESNVVLPNAKVHYRRRRGDDGSETTGQTTREGIKCDCCDTVFSLTRFEEHAGSTNRRPSANIILEDGRSLLDCQRQMTKSRNETLTKKSNGTRGLCENRMNGDLHQVHHDQDHQNDDICSVCHYGGDLILCDQCPSAFHMSCLGLKDVADGDWFCSSCCCGICGHTKFSQGSPENSEDESNNSIAICDQCENKYHSGCLRNAGAVTLGRDSKQNWFCSTKCEEIFSSLNKILGKPIPVGSNNLTWTLLKPSSTHSDMEDLTENYSKLNLALSVMHECFEPSKDPYTNRDIIEDIIFNRESELSRLNFRRFYTMILERDEEVITVGTVRIYSEVAEVPLVATRFHYRRLGMCRILMSELENQLMKIGVGRMTLPSVPGALETWTSTSFGFSKMTAAERLEFMNYNFLDFQGTIMCHKLLNKTSTTTQEIRPLEGSVKFDGSTISAITQEEHIQLENRALNQEPENIATGHGFLSENATQEIRPLAGSIEFDGSTISAITQETFSWRIEL